MRAAWQRRYQRVVAAGGLHIVGTERHESRRIDNQLRGRSGRQGDPGSSRFYLSLEDNLMRIFASDRVSAIMQKLGMQKGEAIEHRWVTKAIENAQQKVEAHNFDTRKHLLEYDDIANEQRKVIYEQRNEILEQDDVTPIIEAMRQDVVDTIVTAHVPPESMYENWDLDGLRTALAREFELSVDPRALAGEESAPTDLATHVHERLETALRERLTDLPQDTRQGIEKQVLLDVIDRRWREHLQALEHLRHGINLRAYAARNPKREFKSEAFNMFMELLETVKRDVTVFLVRMYMRVREIEAVTRCAPGAGGGARRACGPGRPAASAAAATRFCAAARRHPGRGRHHPPRRPWPPLHHRRPRPSPLYAIAARSAATSLARAAPARKYKRCHGSSTAHTPA